MIAHDLEFASDPALDNQTKACLKLWASVFKVGLVDAAQDFFKGRDNWWIDPNNLDRHPGSFHWLCELFDYDPDVARSRARMKFRELARRKDVPKDETEKGASLEDEVPATSVETAVRVAVPVTDLVEW